VGLERKATNVDGNGAGEVKKEKGGLHKKREEVGLLHLQLTHNRSN